MMGDHNISYRLRASDARSFTQQIANAFNEASAGERGNEALAELDQRADEFAAQLITRIVRRGMRVGIAALSCAAGLLAVVTLLMFVNAPLADTGTCGELPCRANGVTYVSEAGGVVIQPGEAFSIELKIEGTAIVGAVPRARDPNLANSIEVEFKSASNHIGLDLKSHVDKLLKYDVYMTLANGRVAYTSSCPLMAGKAGYEMWMDRIEQFELKNFRFLEGGDTFSCR